MTNTTRTRTKWTRSNFGPLTATLPNGEEWTFSRPGGGYVYCDFGRDGRNGTLGKQIYYGGDTRGNPISCDTQEEFETAVKRWYAVARRYNTD